MQAFLAVILTFLLLFRSITSFPSSLPQSQSKSFDRSLSKNLFLELEELSRLVAISYCVGDTGIQEPFECLSHCSDFKGFALAKVQPSAFMKHCRRLIEGRHGAQASSTQAQAATSSSPTPHGPSA